MIRVCCVCKAIFGGKEPLEDKSETHGFCPECFEEWKENNSNEISYEGGTEIL